MVSLKWIVEDACGGTDHYFLIGSETPRKAESWCEVVLVRAEVLRIHKRSLAIRLRRAVDVIAKAVGDGYVAAS